jgi:hypothetical protein
MADVSLKILNDPTVSYVGVQNAIPAVREVCIENGRDSAIVGADLCVQVDPSIASPYLLRIDRMESGETRRITKIPLIYSHEELAQRSESERGRFRAILMLENQELAATDSDIEILAYDQWTGLSGLPELLAAFCMPNDPAVDRLIGKAGPLLAQKGAAFNGYHGDRKHALAQAAALYGSISAERYAYSLPPASFMTGQKIRSPERIADGRVATCLDTTMLFASCLEQVGLNPVLLLNEGHAWVAVWLVEQHSSMPTTQDIQDIRKRVKAGEMIAFETTFVTGSPPGAFVAACAEGTKLLAEESKAFFAIDVKGARGKLIRPLPSKGSVAPVVQPTDTPTGMPELPELPPPPPVDSVGEVAANTPQGRLRKWENKLLDLSLKNKLLNFKETKGVIPIVVPDAAQLEDQLAAGEEFRFEGDQALMEGADPRDPQVHRDATGVEALIDHARRLLAGRRLLAKLAPKEVEERLLEIYLTTKTNLEEGGANTLFIAMGFLRWSEEASSRTYRAPLVLLPVSLKRGSIRGGYSLVRHDDEALVNPTLLQMLKTDAELVVEGLGALGTDSSGIDVAGAWQAFRKAVADVKGWEVTEEVVLGNFSFTKYLMWKDLRSRLNELRKNRVVAHLIDSPNLPYAGAQGMRRGLDLDREFGPQQLIAPLICDSSQLEAIAHAANGRDMVLDGPPGTGKSQTISNLVAHFLGHGKTVLFVSEKIAALNVVHNRLNAMGLGPFCLELHSAKAQKADVVRQLADTLGYAAMRSAVDWEQEAARLRAKRAELNDFVTLLHREGKNGLTVYQASGTKIIHSGWVPASFSWGDSELHDKQQLQSLRELMSRIRSLSEHFTNLQAQGLDGIGNPNWSPLWEDQLFVSVDSFRAAVSRLERECVNVGKTTGIALAGASSGRLQTFSSLADQLLKGAVAPATLAAKAFEPDARQALRAAAHAGKARLAAFGHMPGYKAAIAGMNGTQLSVAAAAADAAWWPKSSLARRKLRKLIAAQREDARLPKWDEVPAILQALVELNRCDEDFRSKASAAEALLGKVYAGLETNWADVERYARWTEDLEAACDRCAGGELDAVKGTREQVRSLLCDHHRLLASTEMIGKALNTYREATLGFLEGLRLLEATAQCPRPLCGTDDEPGAAIRALATTEAWIAKRVLLKPWCLWQALRREAIARGAESVVQALDAGAVTIAQIENFFEYSYQTWWLKRVIDREELLRRFTGTDHDRKIREFRALDERFQKLTVEYIVARTAQRIPNAQAPVSQDSEVGKLRREAGRQRGITPIRQLLQQMPTLLTRLKPCMLMSPLSIAQYLDAAHEQFDVVIFDEASQIPVWDAIGAIARGKQLIVAGDPKQLPPTNFFQKTASDEESEGSDGEVESIEDMESMLDECLAAGLPRQQLIWHYRSKHESLITFSNHAYYGGGLITFPSPVTADRAVSFCKVHGHYDRGGSKTNRAEADAIVSAVADHYAEPSLSRKSVGVVTFNLAQQKLIEQLLNERRRKDDSLDRAIADMSKREPLFIKNLESVQGDERDLILFSVTYGPDASGSVSMGFGPLNHDGGHRRLNVAITRAREGVRIFSTLEPEQIDPSRTRAAGVLDLKNYLEFAKKGPSAILARSTPTGMEPESPFEMAVITRLRERGWIVHPQVGCSNYRIDIAVVNPDLPGEYLMGVECDGRTYHSSATARDRDRLRQIVLEGLGWRLHRIWSTDWWLDPERETQRLCELLSNHLAAVRAGQAATPATDVGFEPSDGGAETVTPPRAETSRLRVSSSKGNGQAVPVAYVSAKLEPARGDFTSSRSDTKIRADLAAVINAEGPIERGELFRRVARAWDIARLGNRVEERLDQLLPRGGAVTCNGGRFFWPADIDPRSWRGMRTCQDMAPDSLRHINQVCPEEVANLGAWILANNGRMTPASLAKKVCELVGMSRVSEEAQKRALLGVSLLTDSGRAVQRGEFLSPVVGSAEESTT